MIRFESAKQKSILEEFTEDQMSEIISTITKGEGFHGLVQKVMQSLMHSERGLHNEQTSDVSNGYCERKVYHGGQMFELRVPRSRNHSFYPMLSGILKIREEEAQKLGVN